MSLHSPERDPFSKTYRHVYDRLVSGAYAPGQRITAVGLAAELKISPTPVREALSHLAGEGLIQDRRGEGYYAPELNGDEIAGLYALQRIYLVAALGEEKPRQVPSVIGPEIDIQIEVGQAEPAPAAAELFNEIIIASGNPVLVPEAQNVAARLRPTCQIEHTILPDTVEECRELFDLWHTNSTSFLTEGVINYHRRREEAARQLASALRARRLPPTAQYIQKID